MSDGGAEWYLGKFGASNRAHWIEDWTVTDTDDNPIDLTDASFSVAIADKQGSVIISGSEDDIISLPTSDDNNLFRWTFSDTDMRRLCFGPYNVGLTISIDDVVTQVLTGELMVYDGVVP